MLYEVSLAKRYSAKKLARTPSIKKKLALLIAEYEYKYGKKEDQMDGLERIAFGCRGIISRSEKDLCKQFDKIFKGELEERDSLRKKLNDIGPQPNNRWLREQAQREIDLHDKQIIALEEMAAELFEDIVL